MILASRDDDRAAGAREPDRLHERGRGFGSDVDDHVREAAHGFAQRADGIDALDVDDEISTEVACRSQARRVPLAATGHHHESRAGVFHGRADRQAADPRPEHGHDRTRLRLRHGHTPADAGAERD